MRTIFQRIGMGIVLLGWTDVRGMSSNEEFRKATVEGVSGKVFAKREPTASEEPVALKAVVLAQEVIRTGGKSRVELKFDDQSICRLGSNTIFCFDAATRGLIFSGGTGLVHVPTGCGEARIVTPAATAGVHGDTVVVRAGRLADGTTTTQFTVLSERSGLVGGNVRITLAANSRVSFELPPGHLAIVPQNATSLNQVSRAEVDVGRFIEKSPMLQDLPAAVRQGVAGVVDKQKKAFASGSATRTEYAVVGNQVVKADDEGNFEAPSTRGTTKPVGVETLPPSTDGPGMKTTPNLDGLPIGKLPFDPSRIPPPGTLPGKGGGSP